MVTKAERKKVRRVATKLKTSESALLFANSIQSVIEYHDVTFSKRKAPA